MKFNAIQKKGSYVIREILPSYDVQRLHSFGFFQGSMFYFSGIVVDEYKVVIKEDRLLALPDAFCTKVLL